ncbi:hypothetical protein N7478_005203 [Penicillium angulare]|uniref:uncharacterized protein n=1 Tax=Penicillium angulare TaxID=116970 RepID=UPI002540FFC7|nr:uncharacterized protein N7478_005203 [Penicillium angulare]KAJ5279831.1 hypothetical protein N7478_005203 [Penicillium angulare]
MVPVPVGIDEEEEEDGLPAQICVQAALQQVQFLRARQRSLEFNGSKVSLPTDQATPISTPDQIRTEFMDIESMIYWAALTFDTSSSLTLNTKSILSSGLLGWESETSWRMVKACTNIFHEQSEDWRTDGLAVTEETANQIIAAAQAWKLYVWKMGTILKEALREGHGENSVQRAFLCAEDAIQQFNGTYRPLLEACERRLQFLSGYTKLRWLFVIFAGDFLFFVSLTFTASTTIDFNSNLLHLLIPQIISNMSGFNLGDLPILPLAESFELTAAYKTDSSPNKVNLGQGVYRDKECQPWVLPSVRVAEEILHKEKVTHEYLPIQGDESFNQKARKLLFNSKISKQKNITTVQTIAGTGANYLAASFCARHIRSKRVFISNPTWDNHYEIWKTAAPEIIQQLYPYYDSEKRCFDFDGMVSELETGEENDVVVLHPCAHNPTGHDPTRNQWSKIAEVIGRRRLFVVFDSAYQGFASGDPDADAWAIRHFYSVFFSDLSVPQKFVPAGMMVCQSFSKNFGLYGERIGALHLVAPPGISTQGAFTHLTQLARAEVSCPSLFGARIVDTILSDDSLRQKWEEDVKTMATRIQDVRSALRSELERIDTRGDWSHIERQIGMFSYTGLSRQQVERLKNQYHIYMLGNGRMSMSGLNEENVTYVAQAIKDVVECKP